MCLDRRPNFPFSPQRSYTPEDCTFEDLDTASCGTRHRSRGHRAWRRAWHRQPGVTLAALDRNPDRLRGVAVIPSGLPRGELEDMHRRGMRGCRMSTVVSGGASFAHLERLAGETFDLGLASGAAFRQSHRTGRSGAAAARNSQTRSCSITSPGSAPRRRQLGAFLTLMRLLDTDRCWVKLASLYRLSSEPYPHRDMLPMIASRSSIASGPRPVGQQLAASDLPRADAERRRSGRSDSAVAAGRRTQQLVLVDNPALLYGFRPTD